MMKMLKMLLGVLIITTSFANAQNECVKRINRYEQAPSVVTIYPCNTLLVTDRQINMTHTISILVDSVYTTEKVYRLYCASSKPLEDPIFETELLSGAKMVIFPTYTDSTGEYVEAILKAGHLAFFKTNCVKNITMRHKGVNDLPNPWVRCEDFFADFIARH